MDRWVKIWIHILLLSFPCRFLVFFPLSLSLSSSPRPLDTRQLCLLRPRPLWSPSPQNKGSPPSGPQKTSFNIPESPDPLDYSSSVLSDPCQNIPVSSPSDLPGRLVSMRQLSGPFNPIGLFGPFQFPKALMKVDVAKNVS